MWYVVVSTSLIIIIGFLSFVNYSEAATIRYTKSDISQKLVKLSKKPVPKKLSIGAMCYEQAIPPNRGEYVCPVCGKKTLYSNNHKIIKVVNDIFTYRKMVKQLNEKGLDIKLNETELCKNCHPLNTNYKLCITIKYNRSESYKICDITQDDLRLISDFLDEKTIHEFLNEREEPLKNFIPRLRILLGVPASDEK